MSDTRKHQQIMTAAAGIFAKYGYRKTTIDEIVAAAGISKGLFYHYYPSKKDLYLHLYHTYTDLLSQAIQQEVDTHQTDVFARLQQISHLRIRFIQTHPDLWGFLFSAYYERHPDVAPAIGEKNQALLQASAAGSVANLDWSGLRKDTSPQEVIQLVTWLAEGFVKQVNAQQLQVGEEAYQAFDHYLDLLKTGLYEG